MSLIADALEAAQRQKSGSTPLSSSSPGFWSFQSSAKRARPPIPRQLGIAMGVFGAVIAIAAMISITTAGQKKRTSMARGDIPVAPPLVQQPAIDTMAAITPAPVDSLADPISDLEEEVIPTYAPPAERGFLPPSAGRNAPRAAAAATVPSDDEQDEESLAPEDASSRRRTKGSFRITMQPGRTAGNDLFQQGVAAQKRGDLHAARDHYTRALALNTRTAELYNNLGTVHRSLGDLRPAEDAYRRAIDLDPRFAPPWSNLGVVLDAQGRKPEATAAIQEALRLDPANAGTRVNLAIQYFGMGLNAEARRLLEDVLKTNPSIAEAQYSLAQVLEKQGERGMAIARYEMFLSTGAGRFPKLEEQVRRHVANLRAANVR